MERFFGEEPGSDAAHGLKRHSPQWLFQGQHPPAQTPGRTQRQSPLRADLWEAHNIARLPCSGTLYAAKWNQTSTRYPAGINVTDAERDGGTADITWVKLGRATNAEIRAIINSGLTFGDIFKVADPDRAGQCPAGFSKVTTRDGTDCLQVKKGQEKAAAFLETSRYASIKGATVEFEKMEGIALDPDNMTMYLAMSRVRTGMSDGVGDIQVPYNKCGAVYALKLDDDYVATSIEGVVSGIPRTLSNGAVTDNPYPAGGPYAANKCDLDGISEPDNVTLKRATDGERPPACGCET